MSKSSSPSVDTVESRDAVQTVYNTAIATRVVRDSGAPSTSTSTDHGTVSSVSHATSQSPKKRQLISTAKESRLKLLYDQLDANKDGKIDIKELSRALEKHLPEHEDHDSIAKKIFLSATDSDKSDDSVAEISFAEFLNYILDHEKHIAVVFKDLDKNEDGLIDLNEVRSYFDKLGIPLSIAEAADIVQKMDRDKSLTVNIEEFQNYLMFFPAFDPRQLANFFRHSNVIDIGEDSLIPEDFSPKEMAGGVWWRHLVAGGVAGAISRTGTAPLDRLKVYMQVHGSKQNKIGLVTGFRYLLSEGGVKSLWRGNGMNVIKIAPESALKFMAYEQIKRFVKGDSPELNIAQRLCSGSLAGLFAQSCIYPMEVLKTRLALRKTGELQGGLPVFIYNIAKTEGLKAFYRGYVPNSIGIIPYAGIDLAVYETLKQLYVKRQTNSDITEPGVLALLACGTTSSTCGQLSSYPFSLIRTRLQALAVSDASAPTQPDTMTGQFRHIIQTEGFFGLYRGITPNFMKVLPAVSISYVVYETVRKQLGVKMT